MSSPSDSSKEASVHLGQRDELGQEVLYQRGEGGHSEEELQGLVHLHTCQGSEQAQDQSQVHRAGRTALHLAQDEVLG